MKRFMAKFFMSCSILFFFCFQMPLMAQDSIENMDIGVNEYGDTSAVIEKTLGTEKKVNPEGLGNVAASVKSMNRSGYVYKTGGIGLKARTKPWGKQVGLLPEKAVVRVTGYKKASDGSKWYRIAKSSVKKYVSTSSSVVWSSADYIKLKTAGTKIKKSGYVYNTGGIGLRARSKPWGGKVGLLPEKAKVTVIDSKKAKDGSKWYRLDKSSIKKHLKTSTSAVWCCAQYIMIGSRSSSKTASKSKSGSSSKSSKASKSGKYDSKGRLKGAPGYEKALNWAMYGCKKTTNPNNGKRGAGAWKGYCLGHVNRSWSIGAGKAVPELQQYSALVSYRAMKKSGKIRKIPSKGPIPAGAPVYWDGRGDYGHKTYGHIAISTGKVDKRGVPTVVDTVSVPISIVPIDKYGKSDGYGLLKGCPII